MKLLRYGEPGTEKPGVKVDGIRYGTSHLFDDYTPRFFENGGIEQLESNFSTENAPIISAETRLGPPVCTPGKLICIGLNYEKHAAENGMEIPREPVVFFKATSSITGPNDHIEIPRNSEKTDWEVELAVVIGKKAKYITEDQALNHVAGYLLHNDVSERAFQLERGGQWVKGKSCDTFAPLGPYLVTKDEIPNPNNLPLWLEVNGKKMQEGNTSDFIFNIQQIISYLSNFMSLMPGDIISTGTPEGVGLGQNPPRYLVPGDTVHLGIDGLGLATQQVKNYTP